MFVAKKAVVVADVAYNDASICASIASRSVVNASKYVANAYNALPENVRYFGTKGIEAAVILAVLGANSSVELPIWFADYLLYRVLKKDLGESLFKIITTIKPSLLENASIKKAINIDNMIRKNPFLGKAAIVTRNLV